MNDGFWGTTEKKEIPGSMNGVLGERNKKERKRKILGESLMTNEVC
jgi:hypothetical protein